MGKDTRGWRKLVKKLRRKKIRQKLAKERDQNQNIIEDKSESDCDIDIELLKYKESLHQIEEEDWIRREEEAQNKYKLKKIEEERLVKLKEEQERKIREEWEEKERRDLEIKEENERKEKELKKKQVLKKKKNPFTRIIIMEEEFNLFLRFLSGDIETPPTHYLMPELLDNGRETCLFYSRTGACRFFERCSRNHPSPQLSRIILIENFFSHFSLEQTLRDEYDTDLNLEYEEFEMRKSFLEFYDDVVPELKKFGTLLQFKVCRNFEPHLRGNVYIQYENIREAVEAYKIFNGRFYNGRQLSLKFIKIDSWKSAICGLFNRNKCPKLKSCNFLHVFRNPKNEFQDADEDFKINLNENKKYDNYSHHSHSSRRNNREFRDRRQGGQGQQYDFYRERKRKSSHESERAGASKNKNRKIDESESSKESSRSKRDEKTENSSSSSSSKQLEKTSSKKKKVKKDKKDSKKSKKSHKHHHKLKKKSKKD